jgi:type I restriction enzyme R subunit
VKITLADGKERTIQHMLQTTFWSPDGKPMSAQEFAAWLFGQLPELFKDEDELRLLWSKPETRKALLDGLAGKAFTETELDEVRRLINPEKSGLKGRRTSSSPSTPPTSRSSWTSCSLSTSKKASVNSNGTSSPALLELKYSGVREAVQELGSVAQIRDVFINFQKHLYKKQASRYCGGRASWNMNDLRR